MKLKTKDKIRIAARQLLLKEGGAGLTIRGIAQHADVNQGLVHHYYGSKENLIIEVIEHETLEVAKLAKQFVDQQAESVKIPPIKYLLKTDLGRYMIEIINLAQRMPKIKEKVREVIIERRQFFGSLIGIENENDRIVMQSCLIGYLMLNCIDSDLQADDIVDHLNEKVFGSLQ